MVNFQERVLSFPQYCRQFSCGESMITIFNCPGEARLMKAKFAELWYHENYIFYVLEGKKIWHTNQGAYEISASSCVLVRKGACILEQFFDIGFCVVMFFIPDEFIRETLKNRALPIHKTTAEFGPVIRLNSTNILHSFFYSMSSYFAGTNEPDQALLELKFKELILSIVQDANNQEAFSFFHSLLQEPRSLSLERVMNENFRFNLKLEQYARLCNRSLSAFKRDFLKQFGSTPGRWLLEKRLQLAFYQISTLNKPINETAFDCGFENVSHFCRCFKERFKISPAASRQSTSC